MCTESMLRVFVAPSENPPLDLYEHHVIFSHTESQSNGGIYYKKLGMIRRFIGKGSMICAHPANLWITFLHPSP